MELPDISEFADLPHLADDFSFETSTPIPRKKTKINKHSFLSPCNLTSEFLKDEFDEDLQFMDVAEGNVNVVSSTGNQQDKISSSITSSTLNTKDPFYKNESVPQLSKTSPTKFSKNNSNAEISCNFDNSILNKLSTWSNDSFSSAIIQKLKNNTSSSPKSLQVTVKRTSLFFALDEAQRLHEQLSQTSVGPFFGLPSRISKLLNLYKGIPSLYDWQKECLLLPAVKQKKNLIYSLPTSGGKTLVAEILIMREILCYFRDAIFVLPYVSLVQEKVRGLAPFAVDLDFVIEEYAGIKGSIPPRKRRKRHTLYICTIEKAHTLTNSLIEAKRMEEIGLIVVDELHMIGEQGGRGASLESMLSKVKFTSKRTQIVGMSATLSNMADLQEFLSAEIYEKDFRPVELKEFVKIGEELYEVVNKNIEDWPLSRKLDFQYTKEMTYRDPDMITGLVMEVIPKNSCLIFCPTKKHCENVANMLCSLLPESFAEHMKEKREQLLQTLIGEGNGNVCSILKRSFMFGIAYHHSGLTMDERKLIEEAYLAGILCCLTCTSTLAAGINLPAKRVILRAPYVGISFITYSRYKQMIGRAGRAGIDSSGESILMMKTSDRLNVAKLLTSDMDSCTSNFVTEPERLNILLLGLIGLGIANNLQEIYSFMNHTLAAIQNRSTGCTPSSVFQDSINTLCNNNLLHNVKDSSDGLTITELGKAAFRGGVDIATVEEFMNRLNNGLNGLALHSHLHLLHVVTPVDFTTSIPFNEDIFSRYYDSLREQDQAAAARIGITDRIVDLMICGRISSESRILLHHFYITLILYDLWNQNSLWKVSQKYQVHRGVLQNLLNSTSALGSTLNYFCLELNQFWAYQQLLPNFVKQLSYCVTMELLPLMELPAVKRGRAKQLFIAGFKTLADIARVPPQELVEKVTHLPYKTATQIVSAAKMILKEKAEALQEEAEMMMEEFDRNFTLLNETSEPAK